MVDDSETMPNISLVPDEELDAMKIKISQLKSDIQREKVEGGMWSILWWQAINSLPLDRLTHLLRDCGSFTGNA